MRIFDQFAIGAAVVSMLSLAACRDTYEDDGVYGETGEPVGPVLSPCVRCKDDATYTCECFDQDWTYELQLADSAFFCWSGDDQDMTQACAEWCEGHDSSIARKFKDVCEDTRSVSCRGWDPGSNVFYSSSADTYYVSWGFVAGFADDPTPLWGCDAGRIVRETEYGFYVESPDASDLLYLLGLRDGDEVISINGYDLGTFDDAFYAYVVLWELQGEYQYTLQVQRGTAVVELNYYLYAA